MSLSRNLANNLHAIKASRKLSLTDFAEELCISRSCLQDALKGDHNVHMATIQQMADALGISSAALLQNPYSQNQLSHAVLLLEALASFQRLPQEDRVTAAELFHRLILLLDNQSCLDQHE